MAKHRTKEEKLKRVRLGSRYVGLDLGQFYWECLKVAAASEELTETDVLRRIIRSWSKTLPTAMQEQAQAATASVEVWKAEQIRSRTESKAQAKPAQLSKPKARLLEKDHRKPLRSFLRRRERISASN